MKKKSARLRPVEKIAENSAKIATEDMVLARNSHQTHQEKLNELIRYRFEYVEQFQEKAKEGMQASQFHQYRRFISQLEVAIDHQQTVVFEAETVLESRRTHWRSKDSHKRAINNVVNRFKNQEQRAEDLREQNDMDESNTQKYNQKIVDDQSNPK